MFDQSNLVTIPQQEKPILFVIIDTEEEFDWSKPVQRENTSVANIAHQHNAQTIFARYGVKPIYVIDYPVASQAAGYDVLKSYYDDGLCDIGAHLHPWVTPPFTETLSNAHTFPGNLPRDLEYAKLDNLTNMIERHFGFRPSIYKAGRYGVGQHTTDILAELGYHIDASVVPKTNFADIEGPDFSALHAMPYRFGPERSLLEVPLSVDYDGLLAKLGQSLYPLIKQPIFERCRLPGIFARLKLLERLKLSPEGQTFDEMKRLTHVMLARGYRLFCLTYHSSTLRPGCTAYTQNADQLQTFLNTVERYMAFFFEEIHGCHGTLNTLKTWQTSHVDEVKSC